MRLFSEYMGFINTFSISQVRTLKGHASWVKNIEYAHNAELLVTSGFDGSIYAWDINRFVIRLDVCQVMYMLTKKLGTLKAHILKSSF